MNCRVSLESFSRKRTSRGYRRLVRQRVRRQLRRGRRERERREHDSCIPFKCQEHRSGTIATGTDAITQSIQRVPRLLVHHARDRVHLPIAVLPPRMRWNTSQIDGLSPSRLATANPSILERVIRANDGQPPAPCFTYSSFCLSTAGRRVRLLGGRLGLGSVPLRGRDEEVGARNDYDLLYR